ncbi:MULTISPECIES: thioredoxin [unclassified Carboxylicivirga]|uniref:thioredoxin n=1 Tax=Carboxylicivirga TaxID=1628153 RepID=UPI003D33B084
MKKLLLLIGGTLLLTAVGFQTEASSMSDEKVKEENAVIYLNADTFKEKVFNYESGSEWDYKGDVPAILDFYADWCGPCKMLSPVLDKIQKEYNGKVQIYKIDTDRQKELAATFGIRSLPTIVFVPLKGEPQAAMGFRSQSDLETMISEILKVEK